MRAENLEHLFGVLKERSGLALRNDKIYLLESRLLPIAPSAASMDSTGSWMRCAATATSSCSATSPRP